jgi:hypothetical protein
VCWLYTQTGANDIEGTKQHVRAALTLVIPILQNVGAGGEWNASVAFCEHYYQRYDNNEINKASWCASTVENIHDLKWNDAVKAF